MARILFGGGVTGMKGSVGGLTFQGNASGNIVRSRPHTSRASTNKQTTAHAALSSLLFEWQNITSLQRDSWNTYAATWTKINKYGQVKRLTGANWFTSVNYMRTLQSLSVLSAPPAHTLPPSPPAFVMSSTATELFIQVTDYFSYTDNSVLFFSSTPSKGNTLSFNRIRKYITLWSSAPVFPLDITSLWESATGIQWRPDTLFPNANVFFCLQTVNKSSGITSPFLCTKNTQPSADDDQMLFYQ